MVVLTLLLLLAAIEVPNIQGTIRKTQEARLRDDPGPLLHLPQQQPVRVRGDRPALKLASDFALRSRMKFERFLGTLCPQKAVLLLRQKSFSPKYLCQKGTALFNFSVRNAR